MNNKKIWLSILVVLYIGPYIRAVRTRNVAYQEDINKIKYLLQTNPEQLNEKDENGETLLYKATKNSSKQIVRFLLVKGAEVNIKNSEGSTPLHIVTSAYIARDLISKGADIYARDNEGKTPLHRRVEFPSVPEVQIIKELIKNGADINAKDNNGRTPLHLAHENSRAPYIKLLFENGANVNAKDKDGATPLHMAVREYKDRVAMLIENGAEVSAKDNNGQTPLHYWAVEHYYGKAVIEYLIAKGADINATDNNGLAPLHLLLKHKSSEASIKHLIAKGADVNAKDNNGQTPLHSAVKHKSSEASIKHLIANGVDVNAKDKDGMTPLHFAAETSSLQEGVDYLVIDSQEKTINEQSELPSLYFIPATSDEEVHEELFKVFAEKDLTQKNEFFGFSYAPERDSDNLNAKLLLANGAQINIKDDFGRTPLHIASVRYDEEIVKTLINNGADVNVKDKKGMTPLHWAAREGLSKLFCLFIHREPLKEEEHHGIDSGVGDIFNNETSRRLRELQPGYDIIKEIVGDASYSTHYMSYSKAMSILGDANWAHKKNESLIAYFVHVSGHKNVIEYLVSKGAKINAMDNEGRSPLSIAKKMGHQQVVNLLSQLEKGKPSALIADSQTKASRSPSKLMLKKKGTSESSHTSQVKSNRPALRLPDNGKIIRYHSSRAIAPFEIKTRSGSGHYFVKLVEWNTKKVVLKVFVRDGRSVEFKVPLGSYELKYAVGKTWYGPELLFGPDTICSKADKILAFKKKGNQLLGHSVELYLQLDGNLQTEEIPRSEF